MGIESGIEAAEFFIFYFKKARRVNIGPSSSFGQIRATIVD